MTSNLFAVHRRIRLPHISIGIVVALRTNESAAHKANKPSRPMPLIQFVSRKATIVALALRTNTTAVKASPMIYKKVTVSRVIPDML